MKSWLDNTTRAGAHAGPQSECDACFENAWWAISDADPERLLALTYVDALADQARADGHHPCQNHK